MSRSADRLPPETDDVTTEAAENLDSVNAELLGVTPFASRPSPPDRPEPPSARGGETSTSPWLRSDADMSRAEDSTHQFAPELIGQLRLSTITGIGPRTMALLLERFGSAEQVLDADAGTLASVAGVGPKLSSQIKSESRQADLNSILRWCQQHDVAMMLRADPRYPDLLNQVVDAPPVLFCRGEIGHRDQMAVAIVGTRHATPYGLRQAERLAQGLARAGVTVISGLARGIDAAAHEGALNGGGRTIAVLGGGLGQLYPREHEGLASAIAADGAVISEHPPMTKSRGSLFPQRNRIVAGLALATLVIEAPERSGALITARLAAEQNREVMALPGPVDMRASRGCNQLIRDGATLVRTVEDVLDAIGPTAAPVSTDRGERIRNPSELKLNQAEREVLEAISTNSTPLDQVIADSGLPAQQVLAVVSVLELKRLIRRLSGQYVSRV